MDAEARALSAEEKGGGLGRSSSDAEASTGMAAEERALLVFVRQPAAGRVKRRLAASIGNADALRFYRACCAHVLPPLVEAGGAKSFVFWAASKYEPEAQAPTNGEHEPHPSTPRWPEAEPQQSLTGRDASPLQEAASSGDTPGSEDPGPRTLYDGDALKGDSSLGQREASSLQREASSKRTFEESSGLEEPTMRGSRGVGNAEASGASDARTDTPTGTRHTSAAILNSIPPSSAEAEPAGDSAEPLALDAGAVGGRVSTAGEPARKGGEGGASADVILTEDGEPLDQVLARVSKWMSAQPPRPRDEASRKVPVGGHTENATSAASGVPDVVHETPAEQRAAVATWLEGMRILDKVELLEQSAADDLGEKMRAALAHVASQGFRKLVLVGSDIPDLEPSLVASAFQCLSKHQVVLGPAMDGGYFLVGVRGPEIPEAIFQGIPWSTDAVLQQTEDAAKAARITVAPVDSLPKLRDIDTVKDLCRWYSAAKLKEPQSDLARLVGSILDDKQQLMEALAATGYTL